MDPKLGPPRQKRGDQPRGGASRDPQNPLLTWEVKIFLRDLPVIVREAVWPG